MNYVSILSDMVCRNGEKLGAHEWTFVHFMHKSKN